MNTPAPSFQGSLQLYSLPGGKSLPIFLTGDTSSSTAILAIGGLTNGMVSLPYHQALTHLCENNGWTFAQPHWTSAYDGYATSSLQQDVLELESAVKHLRAQDKSKIILIGSSTGCQDLLLYMLSAQGSTPVNGAIFQAPISDREAIDLPDLSREAERMVKAGKGDELVPVHLAKQCGVKHMTAYRAWSLLCIGGDDDYFSSDLPPDESCIDPNSEPKHRPLSQTFGSLPSSTPPLLFVFGAKDESFPFHLTSPSTLFAGWEKAARKSPAGKDLRMEMKILDGAGHQVEQEGPQEVFIGVIDQFVKGI